MLGTLFRSFFEGSQAAKAFKIMSQILERKLEPWEIDSLKSTAAQRIYSNEYALALSRLILDCKDRHDLLGNVTKPVDPNIRERILGLFDMCVEQGLVRSEYLIDEYKKIKLGVEVDTAHEDLTSVGDHSDRTYKDIKESYRRTPVDPANKPNTTQPSSNEDSYPQPSLNHPTKIRETYPQSPIDPANKRAESATEKSNLIDGSEKIAQHWPFMPSTGSNASISDEFRDLPIVELINVASTGNSNAQFALGIRYEQGIGVDDNMVEAARWFKRSADQGHAKAQYSLGMLYESGLGVVLDWKKALELYKLADNADVAGALMRRVALLQKIADHEEETARQENEKK